MTFGYKSKSEGDGGWAGRAKEVRREFQLNI